jgi:hypothetical protein
MVGFLKNGIEPLRICLRADYQVCVEDPAVYSEVY